MMQSKPKLLLMLTTCLLLLGGAMFGQRQISGTVKDAETGEALIGATIAIVGQTIGTVTDVEGNFRLGVPVGSDQIAVSYTGYETQTVQLGASNVLTISLQTGALIKEVVVIGYGTVKREDATGLVQVAQSSSFNRGAITGPQELLAGKISGVSITTDGAPGAGSKIRIRGESSLSASNDPLIVVDGVPLDKGSVSGSRNQLNMINPNDIESFTVLKDASAAAIYGNRASGGVIIITTKKGKLGKKISVGYNANASWGKNPNQVDMLTADEYRDAFKKYYPQTDPTKTPVQWLLLGNANTNWQDEIYQTASGHDHNLNFAGGVGKVPYRISLGFTDKNGVLKTDNFQRYSSSINLNPGFLNNTLQVNFNMKTMLEDNHFADRAAIGNALRMDPTQPVRPDSATTKYGGFTTWTIVNGNPNALAPYNPLAYLEMRDDDSKVRQVLTNLILDYRFKFLPALRANLNLARDWSKGKGTVVVSKEAPFAFDSQTGGGVNNKYEQTKNNALLEFYLNYKKGFGKHDVDVMGGYSWQRLHVSNYFFNSDAAGIDTSSGADPAELYLLGLFGRVNYSFNDFVFVTGSLRRDAVSRFAPEFRWGTFPAAAVAFKLWGNDRQYFNQLKLRTSWGITGQQDIGDYYAYLARYQISNPNAQYQFGDQFLSTYRPNGYVGNIKWEESTTYNGGLDFSIVKDRLSGTLDAYFRETKDLLNYIPFPALSNLTNFLTTNVGTMETKGIELSLNITPVNTQKVKWDLATNIARNVSKITKLTTVDDPNYDGVLTGGIAGGVGSNIQIHSVGYQPSSFYVKKQVYDSETGKYLEGVFADINGDSLVNEDDFYRFKNPAPRLLLGITSNLSVGDLTFSFAGRANIGNYVYNNVATDMGFLERLYHSAKYLSNVHQSAVDLQVEDQANQTFSDHFVQKASFFRLDHVTLSYNFLKLLKRNLNVYATVQNPKVWTPYKGLDPEIGNGIDNNIYPRPRTFLVGLNVNF